MWASRAAVFGAIGLLAFVVGYIGADALDGGGDARVAPIELHGGTDPGPAPGARPAGGEATVVPPPTLPAASPPPGRAVPVPSSVAPGPPASVASVPPGPLPPASLPPARPDDGDDVDDGEDDHERTDELDDD
jgi:hypothetical protein